jgi:hypothetical protein
MSLWAQVDSNTLAIYYNYYSSAPKPEHINEFCVDVPIPDDVDYTCAMAVKEGDAIRIVHDPERLLEKQWDQVRQQRNALLASCDWTQISDAPIQNKNEWAAYRTILRNIPEAFEHPTLVTWPAPPS